MDKRELYARVRRCRAALECHGVRRLVLFGSMARDEARPDSDIDVLVEFDGPATFDGYMDVKFLLEDVLGQSIDLVTPKALRPALHVGDDAEVIYAA